MNIKSVHSRFLARVSQSLLLALSVGVAGCSSLSLGSQMELPSQSASAETGKETRKLEIAVLGNAKLNTDNMGRSFPVLVKIYELKSDNAFKSADFFSLQSNDKAVLQDDLLYKSEILLRPGKNAVIKKMLSPEAAAIGVVAEFRELTFADWRRVYSLTPAPDSHWYRAVIPREKIKLNIQVDSKDVRIVELD